MMRVCHLSDVCLSVAYIGPQSRTKRPRKTKIGTEVAHVTGDSDTTFKVKRSKVKLQRVGAYCGGLPHSLFSSNQHTLVVRLPRTKDTIRPVLLTCKESIGLTAYVLLYKFCILHATDANIALCNSFFQTSVGRYISSSSSSSSRRFVERITRRL